MPAKRKTEKKRTKLQKAAAKTGLAFKKTARKKLAKKRAAPKKKLAKKKAVLKKAAPKTTAVGKKKTGAKTAGALKKRIPRRNPSVDTEAFALEGLRARSEGQSGDLQGVSNAEGADSESVEELLEEGNAFEADVIMGVEHAGDSEGTEIRTHEVPEDDVPGEYLDEE
jgi:hypothetical protein